jgi:hypothetical protein
MDLHERLEQILFSSTNYEKFLQTLNQEECRILFGQRDGVYLTHECLQSDSWNLLKSCLKHGCGANAHPDAHWRLKIPPLFFICAYEFDDETLSKKIAKFIEICKECNTNLDINETDCFGLSALHMTSQRGFLKSTEILLENGANVNVSSFSGMTPLSVSSDLFISDLLLKHGAIILPRNEKITPLEAPSFIKSGHVRDNESHFHESEYGGALWTNKDSTVVPCFCSHQIPKVGLAFELALIFNWNLHQLDHTWLRGFISEVSNEGKTFKAIMEINVDHKNLDDFKDSIFEATLNFDPFFCFPYVLTALKKLENTNKMNEMILVSNELRVPILKESKCVILDDGEDHSNENVQVLVKAIYDEEEGSIEMYFADGTVRCETTFQNIPLETYWEFLNDQNEKLKSEGNLGVELILI